jgi:hypothetical protein
MHLLRGDLQAEATAAAQQVCRVIRSLLAGDSRFLETKTDIVVAADGRVRRKTHPKRRAARCWGPHDPNREPLTLNELFSPEDP